MRCLHLCSSWISIICSQRAPQYCIILNINSKFSFYYVWLSAAH
jgi:hypothetical protein